MLDIEWVDDEDRVYWDCRCKTKYIQQPTALFCRKCKTHRNDGPESSEIEMGEPKNHAVQKSDLKHVDYDASSLVGIFVEFINACTDETDDGYEYHTGGTLQEQEILDAWHNATMLTNYKTHIDDIEGE